MSHHPSHRWPEVTIKVDFGDLWCFVMHRRHGLSFKEAGERIGVGGARAQQREQKFLRRISNYLYHADQDINRTLWLCANSIADGYELPPEPDPYDNWFGRIER